MLPLACCNELFEGWPWPRLLGLLAELGYQGVELAPFTLADNPAAFGSSQRAELRRQIEAAGLRVVGLHWLLAHTRGLHLTAADPGVRQATADRLVELARLCSDLGGAVMVLGSPAQRNLPTGMTLEEGLAHAADALARMLPILESTRIDLCLEALAPSETNFLNTLAEAGALMRRLQHPRVRLQLDVKALASETTPIPDLIRQFAPVAGHFHANDPSRRGPGFGPCDFRPILQALANSAYLGWISVEVFDFAPDPETVARESLRYLKSCWPAT
jgi:sugar phosphate isomerase/epimerase